MCASRKDITGRKRKDAPPSRRAMVAARLARRGYIGTSLGSLRMAELAVSEPIATSIPDAIRKLQARYNLRETGRINAELIAFLDEPYCDVPDPPGPAASSAAGGVPWRDPHVTFQYMSWPSALSKERTRNAFRIAFDIWETVCAIRFSEATANGDMRIVFAARDHGDPWPFDGPGHILAHAFYPDWPDNLRGDLHVDDTEPWIIDPVAPPGMCDLVTTAIHESGHAIGLPHSNVPGSVMWPNYTGPQRQLHQSDIDLVRSLYPLT